jgi:hypothetical protein
MSGSDKAGQGKSERAGASDSTGKCRPKSRAPTTQSLQSVARTVNYWQTRALMFDLFAELTNDFRQTETRGPRWLLKQKGGGAYPAELDDVCSVARELRGFASEARREVVKLLSAQVTIDEQALERPDLGPRGPFSPAMEGEMLVEVQDAREGRREQRKKTK